VKSRSRERSNGGAGEEAEANHAKDTGLTQRIHVAAQHRAVKQTFGEAAQVSCCHYRVVDPRLEMGEAGVLHRRDEGDGGDENHVGEGPRQERHDHQNKNLQRKAGERGTKQRHPALRPAHELGEKDAQQEREDGWNGTQGRPPLRRSDEHGQKDDVARHGVGEDVTMSDERKGVQEAAGRRQQKGHAQCSFRGRGRRRLLGGGYGFHGGFARGGKEQ